VVVIPTSPHSVSRAESLYGGESQTLGGAPDLLDHSVHLQLLFQYYCRFGRSGTDHDIDTMDNAMYAKFTRDSPGLLQRPFTAAEADLLFARLKTKSLRRITYGQVRGGRQGAARLRAKWVASRTCLSSQLCSVWGGGGGSLHARPPLPPLDLPPPHNAHTLPPPPPTPSSPLFPLTLVVGHTACHGWHKVP
jgi:hypothetical protein